MSKLLPATSEVIRQEIIDAARDVSEGLRALGIPHALVGGLAVSTHGYERTTRDVDVLVRASDLPRVERALGAVVRMKFPRRKGATAKFHGVTVDLMFPEKSESALNRELRHTDPGDVPVVDVGALVYLKLQSTRAKDWADVIELLKVGADRGAILDFLRVAGTPELREKFSVAIATADSESLEGVPDDSPAFGGVGFGSQEER